ncbi:PREDICTED: glutaminyl-peptide cyclotransferase-like protein [Aptenodytes forsteri]|uniref:glutaminyl-peptide cyclotransferase-like protein n=1 Tax=Aptenodytes forsteri TaxID=9233 RepID=UPI0004F48449|nr:PREDICTED: glutaminyl-peptide cyclotransferase-like protein [Aptenodytes forsteri]
METGTGWGQGAGLGTGRRLGVSQKVLPRRVPGAEQRLRRLGLLLTAPRDQPFFRLSPAPGPVEDDHVPFLQRGVPVLHLIPTPFPPVWHTLEDTEDNLHPPTMADLCKILVAFVAEFLQL